jgi:hypothetical protein
VPPTRVGAFFNLELMDTETEKFNLLDLSEVKGRRFTEEEKNFIKKKIPKKKYKIKYCIWKQVRKNDMYILFVIDYFSERGRPSAVDKAIEVIATRELSDIEYEEEIENFGCCNRIMKTYNYKDVDYLIYEDKKVGVDTPQKFINECRKRGYTKQPDLFGTTWEI